MDRDTAQPDKNQDAAKGPSGGPVPDPRHSRAAAARDRQWTVEGAGGPPATEYRTGTNQIERGGETARLAIQERIQRLRLEIWQLEELLKALPLELPMAADFALRRLLGRV